MKGIDTNILVRFLVRDDQLQAGKALELLENAQKQKAPLFVSTAVLLECIWVLDSAYDCSRDEITDAVEQLLTLSALEFESQPAVEDFCRAARSCTGELDDLLIGSLAHYNGCTTVLTFDKTASKTPYFTVVK
jgi:predicted nucleic-acid-binding protein